jgi:tRNA G37 N-methylase Trm5
MLKPPAPVGLAKTMRHLSVPSKETSLWREKLASNGWLANGCGIHNLGEMRAIALNDRAPLEIEPFEIIELEAIRPTPKHWTERLDAQLYKLHESDWPMSHDQIGDVIVVKIPPQITSFSKEIGNALLEQHSNARIICADNGVKGKFRVRDLTMIACNGLATTRTQVKENGNQFWVDPGAAYYSPRLANERSTTIDCAANLSSTLGRKISVCDPYAGVGPALVPLAKRGDIIETIFGSDLNPKAVNLLELNLPGHWTGCIDARELSSELGECCDLLLVNLPHDFISHLPELLGLLQRGHEVVIRGWAILSLESLDNAEIQIRDVLSTCEIISLSLEPNRSYSPNDTYACIEVHLVIE